MNKKETILQACHLEKRYSGVHAISDVTFTISSGEILGYLGPNGAGKSTTVNMLAGLIDPTRGQVLYRNASIQSEPLIYKSRLGYVPEDAQLYGFLTGWEYLELVGALREISPKRFKEKAESLLQDFGIFPHRHSPIAAYSKGMRQRISIMAALIHDPEVLILDEPFSGLDVATSLIFRDVLKLLAEAGKAIFFCSPVLEMVEKICTHLILLRKGSVVAYGPADEVARKGLAPALEQTFLELADDIDAAKFATRITAAIQAPCR